MKASSVTENKADFPPLYRYIQWVKYKSKGATQY